MAGQDHWVNEPRDAHGRWTTGGASMQAWIAGGVREALMALPTPQRDALDFAVRRALAGARERVAASLVDGTADGVGLLADELAQLSLYRARRFGQATLKMVELLRGIGDGLRARPDRPERIAGAVGAIELAKIANIDEMARILENEAGSYKDQPIMEAVGHTLLNRMRRNETVDVADLRRAYAGGQRAAAPATRNLATMLVNGQLPDATGGATHFYQPYAMDKPVPVPKSKDGRYLTETAPSGYEYVPGVTIAGSGGEKVPAFSRRPNWADGMRQVPMPGIPDSLAKFFVAPGNGHVQ